MPVTLLFMVKIASGVDRGCVRRKTTKNDYDVTQLIAAILQVIQPWLTSLILYIHVMVNRLFSIRSISILIKNNFRAEQRVSYNLIGRAVPYMTL